MNIHKRKFLAACGLLFMFFSGCDKFPPQPDMVDSGSWYESGYRWPHDGNPVESENFVIFSDAASLEARQHLSQICESSYVMIKTRLGITDLSILRIPQDRNNKIHIYAYRDYFPKTWGGQAFYGGFFIYSLDHPQRMQGGSAEIESYVSVVKHELMHAVQTLILGANDENVLYSWFAEGIAIEVSDNTFYDNIDSRQHFDSLTTRFGKQNPVSVRHSWERPTTPEGVGTYYYYPMFWLCVRYLVDPNGLGGSFYNVREVLVDGANGVSFDTSLKNRFGISQQEFEAQFFSLMYNYLK